MFLFSQTPYRMTTILFLLCYMLTQSGQSSYGIECRALHKEPVGVANYPRITCTQVIEVREEILVQH